MTDDRILFQEGPMIKYDMKMSGFSRRSFLAAAGSVPFAAMAGCATAPVRTSAGEIVIPQQKVKILAEADVVVCGGGTAGISAAYCAARHGAKVILLERWPSLGGMATNALVNIWHTSDREKQVIFGFVQEAIDRGGSFVRRLAKYPTTYETHDFDCEGMKVVFDRMLRDAGVRIICDLKAVESVVEGDRIRGVLVDTKAGRMAVLGRIVIDATGDGDVAANAGVPFDYGRENDGRVQGMTMMFELRGAKPSRGDKAAREQAQRVLQTMRDLRDQGRFPQFNDRHAQHYLASGANGLYNMCPASGNPLNEEELTRLSADSRANVYAYLDFWRRELPAFSGAEIVQMGNGIGIRESRRVRGMKTLDATMVISAAKQPDAIGHGFWMIDIHDPVGTGYTTHSDQKPGMWLKPGQSYHIPLGICLNGHIRNLAVIGRCASATHEGTASVRLQSHCMVMGQGVGTCAAMALNSGKDMAQVKIGDLQAQLRKDGVYLEDVPQA